MTHNNNNIIAWAKETGKKLRLSTYDMTGEEGWVPLVYANNDAGAMNKAKNEEHTEQQVRAMLTGAQGMYKNEWEEIRTLPSCDDLIWLYCQDTNTIDGPISPEPNLEQYGWTHWAYANAPSTAMLSAAPKPPMPAIKKESSNEC